MSAANALPQVPPVRLIGRLVMDHTVQMSDVWARAFGGDILSGMCWLTIDMSNLARVFDDEATLRAYLDGRFTDHDRRPLAARALGAGTNVDAETLRRRFRRLAAMGLCEYGPDGAVATFAAYARPEIEEASTRSLTILSSLFRALDDLDGALGAGAAEVMRTRPWESGLGAAPRGRQLFVLSQLEYMFRYFFEDLAVFGGSLFRGRVFQHLLRENNRPLLEDETLGRAYATFDQPPPDGVRRPISIRLLASRLGHPIETTRRHVNWLVDAGLAEQRADGLVIPGAALDRPELVKLMQSINAWFQVMVRKMDRLAADFAAYEAGRDGPAA